MHGLKPHRSPSHYISKWHCFVTSVITCRTLRYSTSHTKTLNHKTRTGFRIKRIVTTTLVVKEERSEVVMKSVPIERNVR